MAQFIPLTPGSKSAVVRAGETALVTMSGTVLLGATFTAAPGSIDFGTLPLTARGSQPITVTNTATVAGVPVFSFSGAQAAELGILLFDDEADSCGKPVAPGATCRAMVQFAPLSAGSKFVYLMLGNARAVSRRGNAVLPPLP